jgi:hypothetical protein
MTEMIFNFLLHASTNNWGVYVKSSQDKATTMMEDHSIKESRIGLTFL